MHKCQMARPLNERLMCWKILLQWNCGKLSSRIRTKQSRCPCSDLIWNCRSLPSIESVCRRIVTLKKKQGHQSRWKGQFNWHPFSQEAQVMRISGKRQSGMLVRRAVRKQLEATMIPVEQPIFLLGSPWSSVTLKLLSGCQSAKITMASIQDPTETTNPVCLASGSLRSGGDERDLPAAGRPFHRGKQTCGPRTFWSIGPFPYTARAPHVVQAMTRWSEALGMKWLVIPIAPLSRSRMQHGHSWIVAAETPPPARELRRAQLLSH